MSDNPNGYTPAQLELFNQLEPGQQLPQGIYVNADGSISVTVEELQVGMTPVAISHPDGTICVTDCGAFMLGRDGDVYAYWRDGLVETKLVNVNRVELAPGVQLERHVQIALHHGTEHRWSFLPHGSLRMVYDAVGVLDEVEIRGLVTHQSKDGTLTVVEIVSNDKANK